MVLSSQSHELSRFYETRKLIAVFTVSLLSVYSRPALCSTPNTSTLRSPAIFLQGYFNILHLLYLLLELGAVAESLGECRLF